MTRLLLDGVYLLIALVAMPWVLRKKRDDWPERFGKCEPIPPKSVTPEGDPAGSPPGPRKRIMLHAVSVGEVNLIRSLVSRLAEDADVIISVTTDTGIARARELYEGVAHVRRYPLDLSRSVRRFLDTVEPDAVGLVELELWPQFVNECAARGIPIAVVNGRLSARSFKRYRAARWLVGRFFRKLSWAGVQDDAYAERFTEMGVPAVETVGTMKWDAAPKGGVQGADELARELGIDRSKPLVVAGSTAPGEHELLRDAMPDGVQLLCAPRRPEWWDEAAAAFPNCVRRTKPGEGDASTGRFILDTIGELRAAYAMADVVVVGRSFGDLFGSDPMEPAALGKPILIGPSVADFEWVVNVMAEDAAIVRTTRDDLAKDLARLLDDEHERRALGARAMACVETHRGATENYALALLRLINAS